MTLVPATCELWIDGVRFADGQPTEPDTAPVALSGLTVTWGRDSTLDQPKPSTCTFTIMDPPGGARFDTAIYLGSTVQVRAVLAGVTVVVFVGRVTDLTARYADDDPDPGVDVVAADQMSDLANRFVGAEPWGAGTLAQRFVGIMAAVGVDYSQAVIDARPGALQVSRMDVDRQSAAALLFDLATTGGAVCWASATQAKGAYLWFEDPRARVSLYSFILQPNNLWGPGPTTARGNPLSACEVIRDPVQWRRTITSLITQVTIRWIQQTNPDTTERSDLVVDAAAQAAFGARGLSVGTILTTQTDALDLAAWVLGSHQPGEAWAATGLEWDLALAESNTQATQELVRALLGSSTRPGLPLVLTELPDWTPTTAAAGLYVEGGKYSFDAGAWTLALDTASAVGMGKTMTFAETNRVVRYVDCDCSVSYLEMNGVGAEPATGSTWAALPGTWASLTGTWSQL